MSGANIYDNQIKETILLRTKNIGKAQKPRSFQNPIEFLEIEKKAHDGVASPFQK